MTRPEQVLAFAFGPLAVLGVGMICWLAVLLLKPTAHATRTLLLWMGFHGLFLCFIQMPSLAFGAHPTDLAKAVLYFKPNSFVRTTIAAFGFDGESFEAKTFYAVDGSLRESYDGEVGETIDLRGGYVIPPFAEAS